MIAVQVIPDRFQKVEQDVLASAASEKHIRRPTRGIVLKDETFATLRLVAGNGKTLPLIDAGSKRKVPDINGKKATDIYSNFFLQSIREDRMEKQQILETFGEPYIFLFGERARVVSFSGILINTFDFNWEAEWEANYDQFLRGTKCVENDARVFLSYDETLVSGYIIGTSWEKNSQERNWVNFTFQMFLTSHTNISHLGSPRAYPGMLQDNVELGISSAEANAYRPQRIDTTAQTGRIQDGRPESPSLAQALSGGLTSVVRTWNRANDIANSVIQNASNALNGTVIRMPVGFAGMMEYDAADRITVKQVRFGGKVTYGLFSENADEYVGFSDHYGSAQTASGRAVQVNFQADETQRGRRLVEKAESIWKAQGYNVPPSQMRTVLNVVGGAKLGVVALGASGLWSKSKSNAAPALGAGRTRQAGLSLSEE